MSPSFSTLVVLTILATCQLTETIRHGSIFDRARAWIESRGPFWAELIGCGFCFSHWAGAAIMLLVAGHIYCCHNGWCINPFTAIIWWLAAVRGANLLNDVTKSWSRTPNDDFKMPEINIEETNERAREDGIN